MRWSKKINFDTSGATPSACSVIVSVNGTDYVVAANHEVLLTARSFGPPQILELSGIGNETILESAGVDTVPNNPNAGENLQDHVYMPLGYQVADGTLTLDELANTTIFDAAYDQYLSNGTGPLSTVAVDGALLSLEQILPDDKDRYTFLAGVLKSVGLNGPYSVEKLQQYTLIVRDLITGQEVSQG